jgi:hypothetical protein
VQPDEKLSGCARRCDLRHLATFDGAAKPTQNQLGTDAAVPSFTGNPTPCLHRPTDLPLTPADGDARFVNLDGSTRRVQGILARNAAKTARVHVQRNYSSAGEKHPPIIQWCWNLPSAVLDENERHASSMPNGASPGT